MKYAFDGRNSGRLDIGLTAVGDGYAELVLKDDGPGYDGSTERPGMGSRLIRAFVDQMRGSYSFEKASGTTFRARLKIA
jgi:two-component sensor histidine kinase